MRSFDEWLISESQNLHPIERAIEVHIKLVNIHPFVDGNGRTARLAFNVILLQNGYPITLIPPILRAKYIDAAAAGNKGAYQRFYKLMAEQILESSRDYLRLVKYLSQS
jgi:Fic family protein